MKLDKKLALRIFLSALIGVVILSFIETSLIFQGILFLFCLGFMMRFGTASPLDIDPVPFCTLLVLQTANIESAFIFLALSVIAIDIPTGRFNHFTLINLISVSISLVIFGVLFPSGLTIILGIILFDLLRILIALLGGLGPQTVVFSAFHGAVYAVLGSMVVLFI